MAVHSRLRILALEPYYGGSHRSVLDGLVEHLDADWTLLTLPARKWKWRMRGAAITMAEQARGLAARAPGETRDSQGAGGPGGHGSAFDLVFASTFLNLAEWRGMAGVALSAVPAVVYFHENQLQYPVRHVAEWDLQFPLTNITTALSAECCVFNTAWNRDGFVSEIPAFLRQFPDHHPRGVGEAILAKTVVLSPPFDSRPFDHVLGAEGVRGALRGPRPRVVWPHRWEHDKDPESFLRVVRRLADEGLDFEVAVAGQVFRETEGLVREAAGALGDRLVHCGEPQSRDEYARLLASSDVAVSTAMNEFFGLAMVEACYAGCAPLVPDRLAYPELYPPSQRYRDEEDLLAKLRALLIERPQPGSARRQAEKYTFERLTPAYGELFAAVAAGAWMHERVVGAT